LILQRISANLIQYAYTTTFLLLVNDCSSALLLNHLQGSVQLLTTIAFRRRKDIARQALGVDPNQGWNVASHLSLKQHDVLLTTGQGTIASDLEFAKFGRETRQSDPLDSMSFDLIATCSGSLFQLTCSFALNLKGPPTMKLRVTQIIEARDSASQVDSISANLSS